MREEIRVDDEWIRTLDSDESLEFLDERRYEYSIAKICPIEFSEKFKNIFNKMKSSGIRDRVSLKDDWKKDEGNRVAMRELAELVFNFAHNAFVKEDILLDKEDEQEKKSFMSILDVCSDVVDEISQKPIAYDDHTLSDKISVISMIAHNKTRDQLSVFDSYQEMCKAVSLINDNYNEIKKRGNLHYVVQCFYLTDYYISKNTSSENLDYFVDVISGNRLAPFNVGLLPSEKDYSINKSKRI